MAQGTRGRLIRAATTGFGVMVCTGLFGCMNWDKPKDTKSTTKPGLPGTPTLPAGTGAANKNFQPNGQFTGAGSNLPQNTGFGTAGPNGQFRPGTTGVNTNTAGQQPFNNYPVQPGNPGGIGSPTVPGGYPSPSVVPVGGVGAAPFGPNGGSVSAAYPPPPSLLDTPLPSAPLPPVYGGSGNGEFAGGVPVPAPSAPLAPPAAPPGGPQVFNHGVGVFGGK